MAILEMATLTVKSGQELAYEQAFAKACRFISVMKGYVGHELHRCLENPSQYVLLVQWDTLEDHTVGFRLSHEYQQWKMLLHPFYEPFPEVRHYARVT